MTLRAVLQGESIQMPATGSIGYVRRPAPTASFAFEAGEECGFIAKADIADALVELKMLERNGPVRVPRFKGTGT